MVFPELLVFPNGTHASNIVIYIEFVILTAVVMKGCVFWGIMQCSPLKMFSGSGTGSTLPREYD
jgi:hypothetical protein